MRNQIVVAELEFITKNTEKALIDIFCKHIKNAGNLKYIKSIKVDSMTDSDTLLSCVRAKVKRFPHILYEGKTVRKYRKRMFKNNY